MSYPRIDKVELPLLDQEAPIVSIPDLDPLPSTEGEITQQTWGSIIEIAPKNKHISKIGKKHVRIEFSTISLYFPYALACFPLVSDGPMAP